MRYLSTLKKKNIYIINWRIFTYFGWTISTETKMITSVAITAVLSLIYSRKKNWYAVFCGQKSPLCFACLDIVPSVKSFEWKEVFFWKHFQTSHADVAFVFLKFRCALHRLILGWMYWDAHSLEDCGCVLTHT